MNDLYTQLSAFCAAQLFNTPVVFRSKNHFYALAKVELDELSIYSFEIDKIDQSGEFEDEDTLSTNDMQETLSMKESSDFLYYVTNFGQRNKRYTIIDVSIEETNSYGDRNLIIDIKREV